MDAKLKMILTADEISRIISRMGADGEQEITMDLHKLSVKEARRLIGNVIAVNRDSCKINLIHGYNHGTAIKDMVQKDLRNPRIRAREQAKYNPGLTTLQIAGAA